MKFLSRRHALVPVVDNCLYCGHPIDGAVYAIPAGFGRRPYRLHDDRPDCRLMARSFPLTEQGLSSYLTQHGWWRGSSVTMGPWVAPDDMAAGQGLLGVLASVARVGDRDREDVLYDMLAWQLLADEQMETVADDDD